MLEHKVNLQIFVVYSCLICVTCLLLLIYLCHQIEKNKSKITIFKIRLFAICGVLFHFISILCALIGETISKTEKNSIYWYGFPFAIVSIAWATATVSIYLLFIYRIFSIFKDSVYKSSIYVYISLYGLCAIYYVCQIMETVLEILGIFDIATDSLTSDVFAICSPIELFCDITLSISLLIMFVRKLLTVHRNVSGGALVNNKDVAQSKLLYLISKQSILTILAIVTTDICLIYDTCLAYVLDKKSEMSINTQYTLHLIGMALFVMDSFINTITIVLSFSFANHIYEKFCCLCRSICDKYCLTNATININR
eukprot:197957_1